MEEEFFYKLGKFLYKLRWFIIVVWLILIIACLPFLKNFMQPFSEIGFTDPHSQSAKGEQFLKDKLGYGYDRIIVIYKSYKSAIDNAANIDAIKKSLSKIKKLKDRYQVVYPNENSKQVSKDKRTGYAVISYKKDGETDVSVINHLMARLKKPANLTMQVGGEPVFLEDTKEQTQVDLYRAEYVATPVAIVTMLLVFGSVVAACLPIIMGGLSALFMLTGLYFLGSFLTLSVFTLNIALLLCLCLSLDYSLFIVSRFRDELRKQGTADKAVASTQATAGKAVFFSGLAVVLSLSGLLLFPINILYSVGVGGLFAIIATMITGVILLPSILSVLKSKVDFLKIPFLHTEHTGSELWGWVASKVVKWPLLFFIFTLALLLFFAYPLRHIIFGISDFKILPKTLQSRQVFDDFTKKFGANQMAPIMVIVKSPKKNILSDSNISVLYNFAHKLQKDPRVKSIYSIVTVDKKIKKDAYQQMYKHPDKLTESLKKFLHMTTKKDMTVLSVFSKFPDNSIETQNLIDKLKHTKLKNKLTIQLTGSPVNTVDILNTIKHLFPYALIWVLISTYLVLMVLLRSIVLPLKAVIMSLLSLAASYGILVFIIQDGHFHQLLNFEPQGMTDVSLIIIIFCAIFGVSMDYEVFLLTRIRERYEKTHDTIDSIIVGIYQSSRIITSAAIIVILICFSFMTADILIVKAFGLGIAVAVFVDAFIIRTIFVPATMALLGSWNWYLPKWLDRILPKYKH